MHWFTKRLTFIIYGSQKVFSGFGEPMHMMQGLGLPAFLGILLALFEFIGGILIILGILTNYIALDIDFFIALFILYQVN